MCLLVLIDHHSAIPRFLRVRELEINEYPSGKSFVKCSCCERTKIGVPCPCFFRIARDARIAHKEIMDVGMFDVWYLKIFNASYRCEDKTFANMLYAAQQVSMVAVAHDSLLYHSMRMLSIHYLEPY